MKVNQKLYRLMDTYSKANYLEELMLEELGGDELCAMLLRALSCDEIIDNLEYIARCCDIELYEEEDEQK